jgi:transcriptional regulator with XRE-family HTH domain
MKTLKLNTTILTNSGLTFSQIAKRAKLSINTVKSIAQGRQRRIDFQVIEQIASVLKVNPMELLIEEDDDVQ